MLIRFLFLVASLFIAASAEAQTLDSSNVTIQWQVANRFRLFRDASAFRMQENAWRQYLIHVDGLKLADDERDAFVQRTSVLGSEHVLNDRRIAFSNILRNNFDWRGWAAKAAASLCYDSGKRNYTACGSIDAYLNPKSHPIELWLASNGLQLQGQRCEWRIGGELVATADCSARVSGPGVSLPYPTGADISVNVVGEQPITVPASVTDLLIVGMGDSFASGEGNPNLPVAFGDVKRFRNLYPLRLANDATGSATWTDTLCHRSLYGQQFRAALQLAVENPRLSVTYLDYSCSGAGIDEGILGPQTYVERIADSDPNAATKPSARPISGGSRDGELYRVLRDLCLKKPEQNGDLWTCPDGKFRRNIDFLFLSVGGNDIGFSNVVAWATLRGGASATIAKFFGATVSADEFASRMRGVLPEAYGRLAKAFEAALPIYSANDGVFDPARVILTAYPDLVTDETGGICQAGSDDDDSFAANQSLDMFSSWLGANQKRLTSVRSQFLTLFKEMRSLAGDHGWTFAGHAYADKMFEGHGFCARNPKLAGDPAEVLTIPCWGKAKRDSLSCESSWSGKAGDWMPYNPATQNYPYALRQRWVRTFNDAYMVINQKVADRYGNIDEKTSAAVFSETTGALHPTAEGHAAMADALLLSVRPMVEQMLEQPSAQPETLQLR